MSKVSASARDAATNDGAVDAMVDASAENVPDASADAGVTVSDAQVGESHRAADSGVPSAPSGGSSSVMSRASAGAGGQVPSTAAGHGGGAAGAAAPAPDPKTFAAALSELFIDMPCDAATPTPLPEGMACSHAPNSQHVEKSVTFGGMPGTRYTLTLRVRAIWEPTSIAGGELPYPGVPFTVGGMVAQNPDGTPSNAINYQQFQIQVAEPAQTYWLNNYQATSHEIYKVDYEASLQVAAGSEIKIIVHDGNELEIGNYRMLMFTEFPPYDKMASLGQSLRLDVVNVEAQP